MKRWILCLGALAAATGARAGTPDLVAQLASPDAQVREAAAWSLGAAPDAAAVPALAKALADADRGVRLTSAWALNEIGTPEAMRSLYRLLAGTDAELAVLVLKTLEAKYDPGAQEVVVRAMNGHPSPEVRIAAFNLLDKNFSDDLLPAFRAVAEGKDPTLTLKALPILVRRKLLSSGDELIPIFVGFLGHADPKVRAEAVRGLRSFEDERVRELLENALADRDPEVHRSALSALASMVDRQSFPQLVKLYDGGTAKDRATILASVSLDRRELMEPLYRKALGDRFAEPRRILMGILRYNEGDWLLPYYEQGARDADAEVRADAAAGLAKHPAASWATLSALAKDRAAAVRVEVLKALAERGDAAAREIFAGAAADPDAEIRVLAAQGHAACLSGEVAAKAIRPLLKDTAPKVRAAALDALKKAAPYEKDTVQTAMALLPDTAPEVRAVALEILWQAKPRGWIETVGARLADGSPEVRRAASQWLVSESDKKAYPHMRKALDDTDPDVRRQGARSWAAWHDPSFVPKLKALREADPDFMVRSFAEISLRQANAIPGESSVLTGASKGSLPPEVLPLFVFPGQLPKNVLAPANPKMLGRYEAVDKQKTPEAFHRVVWEKDDKGRIFYTSWGMRSEAEVSERFKVMPEGPGTRCAAFWTGEGGYRSLCWSRSRSSETKGLISFSLSPDGETLTYRQMSDTVQPHDPSVVSLKEEFKKNDRKTQQRLAEAMQRMGLTEGPKTTFYETTFVFRRVSK